MDVWQVAMRQEAEVAEHSQQRATPRSLTPLSPPFIQIRLLFFSSTNSLFQKFQLFHQFYKLLTIIKIAINIMIN